MNNTEIKIDKLLFWPPLLLVAAMCGAIIINPEAGTSAANKILSFLTGQMGWAYEVFILGNLGVVAYFIFGKLADKRFGGEKPEFSTLSWLGMLFSAGTSAAILYWSPIEFYFYLTTPPFGLEAMSPNATAMASAYPLFHWGISSYALYVGVGVVFGYLFFVQGKEVFRPSTACEFLLGKHARGYLGKIIDIFYMVGVIAGISTSVGLGTPLLSEVITKITGIPHTLGLDAAILIIWTIIIGVSVYGGLDKGIRVLSDFRNWLGFALLAYVLVVGPTSFMFNNFIDSLGVMINNYFRMSLYTDPVQKSGFPQNWTIFYFAWFTAFSLSTGIYLARISRGRTVREFTLGAVFSGVTCVYTYFMIFGNYTLDLHARGVLNLAQIIDTHGVPRAIAEIFATLPFSSVILPVILVLLFISTATVINSIAYTLAMVTTEKLKPGQEPAKWNRLFWALVLGGISLTLIFLGGLKPLQAVSVAGSLPTMIIIAIIFIGFFKQAGKEWSIAGENKGVDTRGGKGPEVSVDSENMRQYPREENKSM